MNNVFEKAQSAATKITVKSALNPLLWLSGILTPTCFIAALCFRNIEQIRNILIYAGLFPMGLVGLAYLFFMLFDRDRLHSEEFQLKKLGIIRGRNIGELPNAEALPSIPKPKEIEEIK